MILTIRYTITYKVGTYALAIFTSKLVALTLAWYGCDEMK